MSSLRKSNGEIRLDKTKERREENIRRKDRLQMPQMRSQNALKARQRARYHASLLVNSDFMNSSYAHPILSTKFSD